MNLNIGKRLRELREARGLSQENLAERAGMTAPAQAPGPPGRTGVVDSPYRPDPKEGNMYRILTTRKEVAAAQRQFVGRMGKGRAVDTVITFRPKPVQATVSWFPAFVVWHYSAVVGKKGARSERHQEGRLPCGVPGGQEGQVGDRRR